MENSDKDASLRIYFGQALHDAFGRCDSADLEVENYLTAMLVDFMRMDTVYGIRDKSGAAVSSVSEMLCEGDIRLNADSFAREREVHRHIGDFLLFWSGLFPEYLQHLKSPIGKDALLNPVGQGRYSYHVASTFDHEPYGDEARVLARLSAQFESYQYGLALVRAGFEGFRRQGWPNGFEA